MKMLFLAALVLFSVQSNAGVGVNATSSSDDIFVCNLTRTAWPTEESPGNFTGSLDYVDLSANPNSPWRNRSVGLAFDDSTNNLFSFGNQWLSQITRLNLAFSYEKMGVGYKIHVCYLGPLRSSNGNGNGNGNGGGSDKSEKIYSLAANLTNAANAYTSSANLYYRVTTTCDLRSNRNDARKSNEISPGNSMQVDFSYTTNWAPFDGTFRDNVMVLNNNWPQRVPKFCEVVFEFKEASTDLRENAHSNNEINLSIDVF